MNIVSSAKILMAMPGICLDRLLKQRFALHESDFPCNFPPQRGGLRSLSVGAFCFAADIASSFRTFIPSPTNS
jgi:hypothetical protein